ncbi:hypothetical protein N2152v2_004546 [Parachlorella kessleri]
MTGAGPRNLTGGPIEWLHIPKAGTSFGNTLLLWACPELNASVTWVTNEEVLPLPASCLARFRTNERKKWPIGNHVPLAGRSEAELHNVFTLIRHPHSRAVSGFHYLTDYKRVGATRYEICDYVRSHPEAHVNLGAQVKFVTGEAEFTWPSNFAMTAKYAPLPPDSLVEAACARLRAFAFVGLSEHWNATVCLFHAMYGGPVHGVELHNVRKGKYGGVGLFHSLDCGDTADERLYACAKELFLERMEQHPHCIRSM